MSWWITRTEVDRDGKPVRVYHRNGGTWAGANDRDTDKVSKAWDHPVSERDDCEVCGK